MNKPLSPYREAPKLRANAPGDRPAPKPTLVRYYIQVASFYVENFGCRATQADGAAIERQFRLRGLLPADTPHSAQFVVLNTCTVTASADQDARAAIRRIRRQNPGCQIVVTGCYAQRAPEEISALPGVNYVVGNSHKLHLADIALNPSRQTSASQFVPLSQLTENREPRTENREPRTENRELRTENREPRTENWVFVSDIFAHTELLAAPVFDAANERTRPNLKVQDGCDNRCSFCVIPYVRGHSRSLQLADVLREVKGLVASGYREVVISGINLGRWGRDLARPLRFESLVSAILQQTPLEKLRISSVEPMDWSDDLIALVAQSPRIARHAHVPLQSGSDRILRAMHRKYRPWHYREKIVRIRTAMPDAAIGADVMVGFPGETAADFEETRRLIDQLPFTYLHVFTYSSRPGTPAAALPNQVPVQVARERNRILRDLAAAKKLAFMQSFIGKTLDAITLNLYDGQSTEALTDNYLKLRIPGEHPPNRWIRATIRTLEQETLIAASAVETRES